MLRSRYLASLEDKPKGWRRLFCLDRSAQRNPYSLSERTLAQAPVGGASSDIEQADEAGPHRDREFERLVEKVMSIGEEGVFRLLVMYL